jgi:hypothetical protein
LERLHLLIGESIQAYAMVEAHQSTAEAQKAVPEATPQFRIE